MLLSLTWSIKYIIVAHISDMLNAIIKFTNQIWLIHSIVSTCLLEYLTMIWVDQAFIYVHYLVWGLGDAFLSWFTFLAAYFGLIVQALFSRAAFGGFLPGPPFFDVFLFYLL